jgi:hypothetical protein
LKVHKIGDNDGGQLGVRTLDRLPYTRVPGVRLRPLGQLSIVRRVKLYNLILKFPLNCQQALLRLFYFLV